ncbi:MAG: DUF1127 domain-containing protein [Gammaproteobacteria bacterium]|nr:DUF1127 domain-containing protein [Gammaproteobacteria bacterium]MDH3448940.1 DUF1127 domain-containing protein [Gammaproteobacteria bacterium]
MKLFTFAIASIVDANTANGLVQRAAGPDYKAYEQRAGRIRSRSIITLIATLRARLAAAVTSYRLRAKQRRDLRYLMQLSDPLLDDIGLSRSDLVSLELGAVTFDELDARRRPSASRIDGDLEQAVTTGFVDRQPEAVNEQFYDERRCA